MLYFRLTNSRTNYKRSKKKDCINNNNLCNTNNAIRADNLLFTTFNELSELFKLKGENFIYAYLCDISVIKFDIDNKILIFSPPSTIPKTLSKDIRNCLLEWTGDNWDISISSQIGTESINKKFISELQFRKNKAIQDKNIIKILETFKGSKIINMLDVAEDYTK